MEAVPDGVTLTADERALLGCVTFSGRASHQELQASCEAAGALTQSLLDRDAVPEIRLRYFTDPALNVGSRWSRQQVFENNGTRGDDILTHGNFLPYLRYFIFGPDLPAVTAAGFRRILADDLGTSAMVREQLRAFVRRETRRLQLVPSQATEEFFKLALECGVSADLARSIRDAARSTR